MHLVTCKIVRMPSAHSTYSDIICIIFSFFDQAAPRGMGPSVSFVLFPLCAIPFLSSLFFVTREYLCIVIEIQ